MSKGRLITLILWVSIGAFSLLKTLSDLAVNEPNIGLMSLLPVSLIIIVATLVDGWLLDLVEKLMNIALAFGMLAAIALMLTHPSSDLMAYAFLVFLVGFTTSTSIAMR